MGAPGRHVGSCPKEEMFSSLPTFTCLPPHCSGLKARLGTKLLRNAVCGGQGELQEPRGSTRQGLQGSGARRGCSRAAARAPAAPLAILAQPEGALSWLGCGHKAVSRVFARAGGVGLVLTFLQVLSQYLLQLTGSSVRIEPKTCQY